MMIKSFVMPIAGDDGAIFGRKFDEKLVPIKEITDVVRVEACS